MTNPDTTTLNGSLEQLGITMANNLSSMGVTDASAYDGLTTLAGKILDIPPAVGGITPTVTIDIEKSPSTIYVGNDVVITAKVNADYDDSSQVDIDLKGFLQGATVTFQNDNTVLGTAVTGSDGIATYTISNITSGSYSITAHFDGTGTDYESATSSALTFTPQIQTVLFAPALDGTDSISNWGGSGHSYTITDGVLKARNVCFDDAWSNTGDWEMTFDMKADANGGVEIVESTKTSADKYCIQCLEDGHLFLNYIPTNSNVKQEISTYTSTTDYQEIKIKKESGTYYWYINNVLITSFVISDSWSNLKMAFHNWTSGRYAYVKNIRVLSL